MEGYRNMMVPVGTSFLNLGNAPPLNMMLLCFSCSNCLSNFPPATLNLWQVAGKRQVHQVEVQHGFNVTMPMATHADEWPTSWATKEELFAEGPSFLEQGKWTRLRGNQGFFVSFQNPWNQCLKSSRLPSVLRLLLPEDPSLDFKTAFLNAVDEYNNYGAATIFTKLKVDENSALQLYGLKVLELSQLKLNNLFLSRIVFSERHWQDKITHG